MGRQSQPRIQPKSSTGPKFKKFTPTEDRLFIDFCVQNNPNGLKRTGPLLYRALVAELTKTGQDNQRTFQSWRAYYHRRQAFFEKEIEAAHLLTHGHAEKGQSKRKQPKHTTPGKKFAPEDDQLLVDFCINHNPENLPRTGYKLYQSLVKKMNDSRSWRSWQQRYLRHRATFEEKIKAVYQAENRAPVKPPEACVQFTDEEDSLFTRYLAENSPTIAGRCGEYLYRDLVENPWAVRHSLSSWRTHYRRNKKMFNERAEEYQLAHGLPTERPPGPSTRPRRRKILTISSEVFEVEEGTGIDDSTEEDGSGLGYTTRSRKRVATKFSRRTRVKSSHPESETQVADVGEISWVDDEEGEEDTHSALGEAQVYRTMSKSQDEIPSEKVLVIESSLADIGNVDDDEDLKRRRESEEPSSSPRPFNETTSSSPTSDDDSQVIDDQDRLLASRKFRLSKKSELRIDSSDEEEEDDGDPTCRARPVNVPGSPLMRHVYEPEDMIAPPELSAGACRSLGDSLLLAAGFTSHQEDDAVIEDRPAITVVVQNAHQDVVVASLSQVHSSYVGDAVAHDPEHVTATPSSAPSSPIRDPIPLVPLPRARSTPITLLVPRPQRNEEFQARSPTLSDWRSFLFDSVEPDLVDLEATISAQPASANRLRSNAVSQVPAYKPAPLFFAARHPRRINTPQPDIPSQPGWSDKQLNNEQGSPSSPRASPRSPLRILQEPGSPTASVSSLFDEDEKSGSIVSTDDRLLTPKAFQPPSESDAALYECFGRQALFDMAKRHGFDGDTVKEVFTTTGDLKKTDAVLLKMREAAEAAKMVMLG